MDGAGPGGRLVVLKPWNSEIAVSESGVSAAHPMPEVEQLAMLFSCCVSMDQVRSISALQFCQGAAVEAWTPSPDDAAGTCDSGSVASAIPEEA